MASPLAPVRRAVADFLAGGPHAPLRAAVMDAAPDVDDDPGLDDAERDWFDELYDAVAMSADDPVEPARARAGVVGAGALRGQLREAGLDRFPATPG
ncbi:hypothetical protein [Roseisolibacter sp. H3M3-2]|uniref:hypothetical protein n=1 Tax=Roseisolibacter sp. H3M3-2 TaxID=3031323 RepID=UPI0023DC5DB8|nr:hypothetical protein [Roseisolibacter sp. H3M3-2]MDF1505820.1 hypothetical protein [Roseisolibacter sp. H3M3-2]